MSFWKRMFGGRVEEAPSLSGQGFSPFLFGWGCELRSSTSPTDALLEEMPERFIEHFPNAFDEPTAKRLLAELAAWTERFIAEEKASEHSWAAPTVNDRLTAAFEALRGRDLVALEDAGVSIQDGWGSVGLEQRRRHRGGVFFHQQDVLDALRGEELLLAFGAFDERPGAPSSETIGHEVLSALTAHGLSPSWSGDASERIRLPPFAWQKRRWTPSPEVNPSPAPASPAVPLGQEKRHTPEALCAESLGRFTQRVTAVRSSAGFDVRRADAFEALWKEHGGARGQLCHVGLPHIFVPAGEQTELGVRNAYLNLAPAEASVIRRRARSAVISKERSSTVRAVAWARSRWTPGGGAGRVGLIVISESPLATLSTDDSPVDWPEWSPYAEVPDSFEVVYRDRQADPEHFSSLDTAARLAAEHTSTGPGAAVLERLQRARYGAMVQCETPDPSDLGYLQFGWAVARWLLQRGDGAVLDTHAGRWWTRDELVGWEAGGWPTGRRFLIQRELQFTSTAAADTWLLGTEGMTKFGRPDLLVPLRPERLDATPKFATATIPGWAPEALEHFATQLALGARFHAGDVLALGSVKLTVEEGRPGLNAPAELSDGTLVLVPSVPD